MKKLVITLSFILVSMTAMADQKPTLTCRGENVTFQQKSPYLGEDSKYSQNLYILKSDQNDSESRDTAYFLNVFEEGATGTTILTGKNEVGGNFQLQYKRLQDVGDGSTIKMEASGSITYSHGQTLKGRNVPVKCVLE